MSRHRPDDNRHCEAPRNACARTRRRLIAYIDGDLDVRSRRAIQAHLDTCAECRREWEWHRQAEESLITLRRQAPPAGDMRDGFYRKLAVAELRDQPRRRMSTRQMAPAFAVCVMVLVLTAARLTTWLPRTSSAPMQRGVGGGFSATSLTAGQGALAQRQGTSRPAQPALDTGARRTVARSAETSVAKASGAGHQPVILVPVSRLPAMAAVVLKRASKSDQTWPPLAQRGGGVRMLDGSTMQVAMMAPGGDPLIARRLISLRGMSLSEVASAPMSARSALISEEVNVHIVNDRDEEVGAVHIAPESAASADAPVIHVEADMQSSAEPQSARAQ